MVVRDFITFYMECFGFNDVHMLCNELDDPICIYIK